MKLQELERKIQETFPLEQSNVLKELVYFMDDLVKVSDFRELKEIVKELGEAQKQTQQRLNELVEAQKKTEQTVKELSEAQKKTEQQVKELSEAQKKTEQQVKELSEAQKKTEQQVKELSEAQKKTEQTVKELSEAQKKTEQTVKELAEALKQTQEELRLLIHEHRITRQELGGLSHSFGYLLEDRAYKGLPSILEKQFNIKLQQPLKREILPFRGDRKIEINILGKGIKNQKEIWILGEAKSQLKKKHVEHFLRKQPIFEELFPGEKFYLLVTYMTDLDTKQFAEKNQIHVYYSYELPL